MAPKKKSLRFGLPPSFLPLPEPPPVSVPAAPWEVAPAPTRTRLPDTRDAVTRKFKIGDAKVYVTVGLYPDGKPGELFITADKAGGLLRAALDAAALSASIGMQYGAPLSAFASKFRGMAFDPRGFTGDNEFPQCSSVLDLVSQWLMKRFP